MKNASFVFGTIIVMFCSCKKKEIPQSYASINVVNSAINAGSVKINYYGKNVTWSSLVGSIGLIGYGENQVLTVSNLNVDYPFTIVPALDTTKTVVRQKLFIEPNGRYTLFATGQSPNFDAVFIKETSIGYNFTDSAIAVRFVNLSPNSPTVNITLANNQTTNEFTGLVYKQITAFKNYTVLKVIPSGSITFQIRDANSDLVLSTYTIPATVVSPYLKVSTSLSRFKSLTLAIKGLAGTTTGTNAYSVFPIAHY